MKDKKALAVVFIALMLATVTSMLVCYARIDAEKKDNSVSLVLDYADVERLSLISKSYMVDLLQSFKAAGIDSVAVTEDIVGDTDLNLLSGVDPKKQNLYFKSKGLSLSKIANVENAGLKVVPRIRNVFKQCCGIIDDKIKSISKYGLVIFAEEEVLGYQNYLEKSAKAIKNSGMKYGYIEFGKQLGDNTLANYLAGSMVKVHSIPIDEIEKLTRNEMVQRFVRAARERNIRVLYVHLFQYPAKNKDLIVTNLEYIKEIKGQLDKNGFVTGKPSSPSKITVQLWQKHLISLGVGAGAVLLISSLIALNLPMTLGILIIFILMPSVKLVALVSAIVFPSYAVISQFPYLKEKSEFGLLSRSVSTLMSVAGISAMGGIFIAALLSDKLNLLGIEGFSGVKIAFVMPVIIVASYFFFMTDKGRFEIKGSVKKFIELMNFNITFLHVVMISAITAAAALMILRSGNFGLPVPGLEKAFRNALESALSIRPRTKEFLIGYPMLILACVYYFKGGRRWLWLMLSISVLAPISLVNSFCHVHTPLTVTIVRCCVGLVLGVMIGVVAHYVSEMSKKAFAELIK